MPKPFSLSPSKLSILKECPRCFYDAVVLHVARPRGAFPSLPGGMGLIVKAYVDQFRGALPPQLQGRVPGVLYPDLAVLRRLRNWRSGLSVSLTFDVRGNSVGVKLIGALDDLLVVGSQYAPLDTKTKGSAPKDDGSQFYQTQLDCYALLLEANGMPPTDSGFLWYWWPATVASKPDPAANSRGPVEFETVVYEINTRTDRARTLMQAAADVLTGERPVSASGCDYCQFALAYQGLATSASEEPEEHESDHARAPEQYGLY